MFTGVAMVTKVFENSHYEFFENRGYHGNAREHFKIKSSTK